MKKLLVVDENPPLARLLSEVLPDDITVVSAPSGVYGGGIITKEQPNVILAHVCCKDVFSFLEKLDKEQMLGRMQLILMGNEQQLAENAAEIGKYPYAERVVLPFELDLIENVIDEAFITALGQRDELTGFYKKPCFDGKLEKLMQKRTDGVLFYINIDKYSFASNNISDAELQLRLYALKQTLDGAVMCRNGDYIIGFFKGDSKETAVQRLNKMIEIVGAAEQTQIYISAGAACAETYGYNYEDMCGDADKALGVARGAGKNCCRFYR